MSAIVTGTWTKSSKSGGQQGNCVEIAEAEVSK